MSTLTIYYIYILGIGFCFSNSEKKKGNQRILKFALDGVHHYSQYLLRILNSILSIIS